MKKIIMILFLILFWSSIVVAAGTVSGKVKYANDSPCENCKVEINSEGGWQTTYTDGNGRFSINVKGCYVNDVYVNGKKIWSGSKDSCGGLTLSLTVR